MCLRKLYVLFLLLFFPAHLIAANHYILDGGSGDGSSWSSALDDLPGSLTRGDTYYVGDGNYSSYTFDDAESTTTVITIKKATASDHGTETGWSSSYGDGQAVLGSSISFREGYFVIDGNGTHTVPSNTSSDYGFKISHNSSTSTGGIVAIGESGYQVSNITIKYTHVYNTTNGDINNGTVGVRFYPTQAQNYVKLQNCYFQNCGKDGFQLSSSNYVLIERCYIERYGLLAAGSPDYHGQTIQAFYTTDQVIMRWNIWEGCEGQALFSYGDGSSIDGIRFYGNVVFNPYGTTTGDGFNSTGGIIGNAWPSTTSNHFYIYNNSFVNIRDSYTNNATDCSFLVHASSSASNMHLLNNMFYNDEDIYVSGSYTVNYNATGGLDSPGGSNLQTGVSSSIFQSYTTDDFRLASATDGGMDLTGEGWWDTSDSFFEFLDSDEDMYGNTRGDDSTWDRGAFEYDSGDSTPPTLSSATIASNGTTLTLAFDENVSQGSGYNDSDWDIDCVSGGNNISVIYSSGDGTTSHVYTIGQTIFVGDTCNIDFNGDTDSMEDDSGNDLAAIVSDSVTNNSTQIDAYHTQGMGGSTGVRISGN